MTFGEALEILKAGGKIFRSEWLENPNYEGSPYWIVCDGGISECYYDEEPSRNNEKEYRWSRDVLADDWEQVP